MRDFFPPNTNQIFFINKIPHRPLLPMEMTHSSYTCFWPLAMEGGVHHSWRWQSPQELFYMLRRKLP